jgi:hypothetical protein
MSNVLLVYHFGEGGGGGIRFKGMSVNGRGCAKN